MNNASKKYSSEQILTLAKAIDGHSASYEWLKKSNCIELAAVYCGLINCDNTKSMDWLRKYNFRVLWSFVDSFDDNNTAFQYLMNCSGKEWGATVCASYGDNKAIRWLVQYGFRHYVLLGKAIYELNQRNDNRRNSDDNGNSGSFGFFSSSDGFDSFGGGDFGGGGSGGDW